MLVYNLIISIYHSLIYIFSFFNKKANLFISGRENWENKLRQKAKDLPKKNRYWFHCASLGEFEQGRPLMEKIKTEFPETILILSFYSPSGYEIQKNYAIADLVTYLPTDSKRNAEIFLEIIQPEKIFFIKYEFWLNYLNEIKKKKIPCFLVSGVFRPNQIFFKFYGIAFRKALSTFTHFFLQNENSMLLLEGLGFKNISVVGDTRFDRVIENSKLEFSCEKIEEFSKNSFVIVAGSTWPNDEEIIIPSVIELKRHVNNLKIIIAPHEVDTNSINKLNATLIKNFREEDIGFYSQKLWNDNAQILVIDTIGILSKIYRFAEVAIIGGGFDNGIHNILEPLAYRIPVVFGNNFEKFEEAKDALKLGFAKTFKNKIVLIEELNGYIETSIQKPNEKEKLSAEIEKYMNKNSKATDKIVNYLKKQF